MNKKKNSKFSFAIHADYTKGPNRETTDPNKALRFFNKLQARGGTFATNSIIRATHLPSGLIYETNDASEFQYFIGTVVEHVGTRR